MSIRTFMLAIATTTMAFGHAATHAADTGKMVVRVYPVGNLVRSVPDYPYQPGLPTTNATSATTPGVTGGNVSGGLGGGGMGGGGFFQIGGLGGIGGGGLGGRQTSYGSNVDLNRLIDVIQSTIAPLTWSVSGGEGTIAALGHSLVIRQTEEAHAEIKQLISALSQQSDNETMLTVQAYLLTLPPGEETAIWKGKALAAKSDAAAANELNAELRETAEPVGQITCFSGQQVYLASGEVRNIVKSLTPVVSAVVTAYQPVMEYPHIGTLLELKTTIDPGEMKFATMDVRCTVTEWQDGGEPIRIVSEFGPGGIDVSAGGFGGGQSFQGRGGRAEGTIDRVNMKTQQMATTVRVPVTPENESPIPVIVGSIGSPSPSGNNDDEKSGLTYLIMFVTRP